MNNPLKNIIKRQKDGQAVGIYSACSANEFVIKAVLEKAKKENSVACIEATANQCDQNGGYTGMTPMDFKNFVMAQADEIQLDHKAIFLGGDHLGPLTWTHLDEAEAMANAKELIRQYVLAGFSKIHVDTSMKVASDNPNERLRDEVIAKRGAALVKVANEAFQSLKQKDPNAISPVYIVGSEVPIPGGAQEDSDDSMHITTSEDLDNTITTFQSAFKEAGISDLWEDVIAIVVQPGVEEKDAGCVEYEREKAAHLKAAIQKYPTLIFEGHSTDYQTKHKLKQLVEDHIAILKVGPGLTYAMREALFSLANIEAEYFANSDVKTSHLIEVLEEQMLKNPSKWNKYYTGDERELKLKRKYSFSDRCRYYMPSKEMEEAIATLCNNLNALDEIPLYLLSQYMPIQYTKVREGLLENKVEALIKDRITNTLDEYTFATNQAVLAA